MLNDFLAEFAPLLIQGTVDTLVMVFASTAVAYVIGTVLGVILHLTAPGGLRPVPALNAVLAGWSTSDALCRSSFCSSPSCPPRRHSWAPPPA